MSDETSQPADQPKRPRAPQGTRRAGRKRMQKATPVALPSQDVAPDTAPDTTGSAVPQALPTAAAPTQPAPDEPPIGKRWGEFSTEEIRAEFKKILEELEQEPPGGGKWGEFPLTERQAELKWMIELWEQDFGNRPGPFAYFKLTGADVYWLAALAAGAGFEVGLGKKALDESHDVTLNGLHLECAKLEGAQLDGAILVEAHLERANLLVAQLAGANLSSAHLEGANLSGAQLKGANLRNVRLEGADLSGANLEGADLRGSRLTRQVNLREATFDVKTRLAEADLDATLQVADALWNGVPLIGVSWGQVPRLGDEAVALHVTTQDVLTEEEHRKTPGERMIGYQTAARTYRQLAVALRGQGITEAADRFTYRALIMQRKALLWQLRSRQISKLGSYLFSLFLAVLTGYGFRMSRIVVAYVLLIGGFAAAYWSVGVKHPRDISFWMALIVSVTAFHGRVFTNPFAPNIPDAQVVITAIEAVVGLVIEGVFIAMLTQRYFNR